MEHKVRVKIEQLENFFQGPTYVTTAAAGADLFAGDDAFVYIGQTTIIGCGFKMELPFGYEAQIRSRSGLSVKGIIVANSPGTIDADYRNEVKVILANFGNRDINEAIPYLGNSQSPSGTTWKTGYQVKRGDRIAQMIIAPVVTGEFELTSVDNSVDRGGGLGSTGR